MSVKKEINRNTTGEELVQIFHTDLTGKVVIVTGSNSGIGLETARVLASVHAKVIIPCRTIEKANDAIKTIKETVDDADLVPMKLDLSDLSSIKSFADEFLKLNLSLDILINNAGVMGGPRSETKNGFESQFGVNHIGHFYLTTLLMEKLKTSAPGARIINLSSNGNYHFVDKKGLDFNNLNSEKDYNPATSYGASKLCNVLFTKELQRRFNNEGLDITVVCVHPGTVKSNLGRSADWTTMWSIVKKIRSKYDLVKESITFKYVKEGASTSIYCAIAPDVVKGDFYADNAPTKTCLHEQADNKEMAEKLWKESERLISEKTEFVA